MQIKQNKHLTREQWLNGALGMLIADLSEGMQAKLPTIKASIGQTGKSTISRSFPIEQSANGSFEILISVHCDDSLQIMARLSHELMHALTGDCKHHSGAFHYMASHHGLLSPFALKDTLVISSLKRRYSEILKVIGAIPHNKGEYKPEQKGRNNNVVRCRHCGFKYNTSAKWISLFSKSDIVKKECNGCGAIGHLKLN